MGDQNVTFIAGMLTVCVQNYKALLPRPGQCKPTWRGGGLPLRGHCQEDGWELPAGQGALNRKRGKLRAMCTLPSNSYSGKPLFLLEVGVGMGEKGEEKPGI